MRKKKLFIFEFISGGGYNGMVLPSSLFCEGYSMLRSIIEDFNKLNFEIYTLLDERIAFLSPYLKVDNFALVGENSNYIEQYKQMLFKSDSCFIIAPEFSNILYNLTGIATKYNKEIYSIGLEGIKLGASKMNTYKFFTKSQVPTPETFLIPTINNRLDVEFINDKFHELNHSIIIKPEDGVGAELVFHIHKEAQIYDLLKTENNILDNSRTYILQRFIDGVDMSMSLIGIMDKNQIIPYIVGINTQNVLIRKENFTSQYNGGMTPAIISNDIRECLYNYLQQLDFSHFKGYFGIDFIKTYENSIQFIEINPRLTTSYLGIRNIYDINPLQLLVKSIKSEIEKISYCPNYVSEYYRLDLKYIGQETIDSIRSEFTSKVLTEIPELITPPLLLDKTHSNRYSCFISTKAEDIANSELRKKQIIEYLKHYDFIQLNGNK